VRVLLVLLVLLGLMSFGLIILSVIVSSQGGSEIGEDR